MRMALAALVLLASCSKAPAAKGAVYDVYRGKREVLVVRNEPGRLTSTAELGRGEAWPKHPFLSADALAPEEEDRLGALLRSSTGFDDFLSRLESAGYDARLRR